MIMEKSMFQRTEEDSLDLPSLIPFAIRLDMQSFNVSLCSGNDDIYTHLISIHGLVAETDKRYNEPLSLKSEIFSISMKQEEGPCIEARIEPLSISFPTEQNRMKLSSLGLRLDASFGGSIAVQVPPFDAETSEIICHGPLRVTTESIDTFKRAGKFLHHFLLFFHDQDHDAVFSGQPKHHEQDVTTLQLSSSFSALFPEVGVVLNSPVMELNFADLSILGSTVRMSLVTVDGPNGITAKLRYVACRVVEPYIVEIKSIESLNVPDTVQVLAPVESVKMKYDTKGILITAPRVDCVYNSQDSSRDGSALSLPLNIHWRIDELNLGSFLDPDLKVSFSPLNVIASSQENGGVSISTSDSLKICLRSSRTWIKAIIRSASLSSKPWSFKFQSFACVDFHLGSSSFGEFSIMIPNLNCLASGQNSVEVSIDGLSTLKFHNLDQFKQIGQFVEDQKIIIASSQVESGRTLLKVARIQVEVGELGACVECDAIAFDTASDLFSLYCGKMKCRGRDGQVLSASGIQAQSDLSFKASADVDLLEVCDFPSVFTVSDPVSNLSISYSLERGFSANAASVSITIIDTQPTTIVQSETFSIPFDIFLSFHELFVDTENEAQERISARGISAHWLLYKFPKVCSLSMPNTLKTK
jgi:hypothetical protein